MKRTKSSRRLGSTPFRGVHALLRARPRDGLAALLGPMAVRRHMDQELAGLDQIVVFDPLIPLISWTGA